MGFLHEGHKSLIKKSISENAITVVSIFVNPTQFNNINDLDSYPVNYQSDLRTLESLAVDFLFYPQREEIYEDEYSYKVVENNLSLEQEGKWREGHFSGVLTVVLKLLNIVKPERVYLGEKDFQQFKLIQGMVKSFFIETKVIFLSHRKRKVRSSFKLKKLRLFKSKKRKHLFFRKCLILLCQ